MYGFKVQLCVGYQPDIPVLSDVFHGFAEHIVVHEFEEILFKIVLCLLPKLYVEIDVGFSQGDSSNSKAQWIFSMTNPCLRA